MKGLEFDIRQVAFLLFLLSAAWQDVRQRTISVWTYWGFGAIACLLMMIGGRNWDIETTGAVAIGIILLLFGRWTGWSIGEGDGWFFVVAGIYLGFWANLALLFYGLLLCGFYCLGVVVWGWMYKLNVRKLKVPFLPFLLPVGIWIIIF